ncbi:MAG: extracellular solute-binding protein [Anaerolineales bacterium]|nr:extracellular solute-binding protein [Anaerolineales bacterium]MDW8276582.1 extracellular solute-binding protein [Anaerolineales bacterium]
MKTLSKWINTAFVLLLAVSLAACGSQTTPTAAPVEEPTTAPTVAPTTAPTEAPAEPVTIRYANWNVGTPEENNLQRQLIAAYMEMHPNVTIEFVDMSQEGKWDEKLTNYAAKGELPDVFMADVTPLYVKNGWLADLTSFVENDPDWQDVPQVLKDAVTYNGKVLGLPAAQFVMGYFVNQDLFEAANLDAPTYGVSVDDFFAATTALTNVQKGKLGLDEMEFIMGWYPSTQDPNLKWFSFDGQHMNYNSAAFKAAVAKAGEMKPHTWQGLTDEQKKNFKSVGPWELFLNQESGVRWDGGWAVPGYASATFKWDFMGIPGGNQAMVADIIVVSKTASNPEAAYDFAKWMTFSKAGYAKEAELAKAAGGVPTRMPVSVNAESIDLYMSFVGDKPGLRQALENLDNSLLESLAKIVPGYVNARWEGKPGIDIGEDKDVNMWYMFNFANDGKYKYEDYAAQLEEFANKILDDARAGLNP